MSEVTKQIAPGTALILPKYLLTEHVREINTNFVDNRERKRIDKADEDGDNIKPPKKKLKGQNKRRPREKKVPKCQKLCFSMGTNGSCSFGERCSYSHDVDAYLSTKPKDIGKICYLFNTFGRCPYSFSCRFALEHISDGKNVINDDLWNSFKNKKLTVNYLSKELQRSLWKRDFNFDQTKKVLKMIETRRDQVAKQMLQKNSDHLPKITSTIEKDTGSSNGTNISIKEEMNIGTNIVSIKEKDRDDDANIPMKTEELNIGTNIPVRKEDIDIATSDKSTTSKVTNTVCKIAKLDPVDVSTEHCGNVEIDNTELKKSFFENNLNNTDDTKKVDLAAVSNSQTQMVIGQTHFIEEDIIKLRPAEIKKIDFQGKLYLAPLTTVGNLPFRRICKEFGADITCGEMALALSLLQGQQSEWALLKRHHTEDLFGVQICGAHADLMTRCGQLLTETMSVDFVDINMGCPLDMVYRKGAGCGLMNRLNKLDEIILGMSSVMNVPLTVKMRAGIYSHENSAHNVIKRISNWKDCVSLITLHGRSREQRYTRLADWSYINQCAEVADPIPLFGSGDILSYEDYNSRLQESKVSGAMIARGALIKPWIFKEIKEQKHWDISSGERFEILKSFTNYGLEHWGSDTEGVEKTRRFLLEWLSFSYRYIPVGILERVPQQINQRPPAYFGRDELETLMASPSCGDWVKISEMLLGPVPENFLFLPKHKANAYQ